MARELDETDLGRLDNRNRDSASDTHSDLYSELSSADRHEGSGSEDTVCADHPSEQSTSDLWHPLAIAQCYQGLALCRVG